MENKPTVLSEEIAADLAEFFSSFSDSSRVRIISALAGCELSVGEIAEAVSLSESATSHHLRGLRQKHLVRTRKEGRQVYYCLDDEHILGIYQTGLDHVTHQ
ncbi:MAG: helix-turn-helix transcriptional regulator [Anaerolineaceae bacterium]|nr:helix-turn-helix transcriptional regulator [Anaerolineaceae bacterium]